MISFSQLPHRGNSTKAIGSLHVVGSGSSCGIGAFWKTIGRLVHSLAWYSPADGRNGRDAIIIRIGYSMEHNHIYGVHEGEREGEPAIRGWVTYHLATGSMTVMCFHYSGQKRSGSYRCQLYVMETRLKSQTDR